MFNLSLTSFNIFNIFNDFNLIETKSSKVTSVSRGFIASSCKWNGKPSSPYILYQIPFVSLLRPYASRKGGRNPYVWGQIPAWVALPPTAFGFHWGGKTNLKLEELKIRSLLDGWQRHDHAKCAYIDSFSVPIKHFHPFPFSFSSGEASRGKGHSSIYRWI